ncbi:MAG: DUF7901 domain-containing protein, partial [Planctomycetota bacterium]
MGWEIAGEDYRRALFEPLEPRLLLDGGAPVTEINHFPYSLGQIELIGPDGSSAMTDLAGPSTWHVTYDGVVGGATDPDGDGLEQVPTEMVALSLSGLTGPVQVSLRPLVPTLGEVEETTNPTAGILDVQPFAASGTTRSFFDAFLQVELAGTPLIAATPVRLQAMLSHQPPDVGETYVAVMTGPTDLLTLTGDPSGFAITGMTYTPNPGLDFGDAPDPYPTRALQNGASHYATGQYMLGAQVDTEHDGQPDPVAEGDDLANVDDEDGVDFWYVAVGEPGYVEVEAVVPPGAAGYVDAWIDFNADGTWDDPGEHVVVAQAVSTGVHTFSFMVPTDAVPGDTFARTRISSDSAGLPPTGAASDGEVEDQVAHVQDPSALEPKWEQYPEPADTDIVYYGWNELSVYGGQQIAADDWVCMDDSPVTTVGWWGSFIDWPYPDLPPEMPDYFHVAVWTDMPAGIDAPWSHPDMVLQEWEIWNYDVAWSGWDYDPRYEEFDAAFRFDAVLPEPFQQFTDEGIYWVSIAAAYPGMPGGDVPHPWGWKTVRRDPYSPAPDAAVRIFDPIDPIPGMIYMNGEPIETVDLDGNVQQWDLAFELGSDFTPDPVKWTQSPDLSDMGMDVLDGPYSWGPGLQDVYEKYLA